MMMIKKIDTTHTHLPKRTNVECAVVEKKKKSLIHIYIYIHIQTQPGRER